MYKFVYALFILVVVCSTCLAGYPQTYSMRDAQGRYAGRFQSFGNRTNIYNRSGMYTGRFEQRRGYINQYDRSGRYSGRITVR